MGRRRGSSGSFGSWAGSRERAELVALYAEADRLLAGWSCTCSGDDAAARGSAPRCCLFGVTGREPYPTAVEIEEVRHALHGRAIRPRSRHLPLAGERPCPLLRPDGGCSIYGSRPFGCRTFFCDNAETAYGEQTKGPRAALQAIGRRIADLSARFAPSDPHPRPLVRALVHDDAREHNR